MSDHPLEARLISHRLIADLAARTALDTRGVLRLEPTLKGLLTHLRTGTIQNLRRTDTRTTSARHDGVFVTVHNGIADVQLDIATDIAFAALEVAHAVREQIARTISHTGLIPGRIDISVLAIEHAPTAPDPLSATPSAWNRHDL
ncbi:Asp23/Gls24 family envelope stress response protein [Arthrobacter sp. B6]|uniref:Asp23/Gls24 family envelope stress response protein n=1 Tax=Arthrobacter sp. B6 TaxID=1570137 RepID=UPI0008311D27|nr:Asp23/Gls24 family envelope stress response protein [Arthrobacter sp. B6]